MKNNAFKHTFWIGVFIITMSSLLTVLIGINVYGFLEDRISLRKNTLKTEKNFEVDDYSYNNKYLQLIDIGEGLHNNHHAYPNKYDQAYMPGEIDPAGWVINKFLI